MPTFIFITVITKCSPLSNLFYVSSMSTFIVSTYMCIGDVGYDGELDSLCSNDSHECYSERRKPLELPCTN